MHYPTTPINNLQLPNYNPFILKFITGNIKSCRLSLRKADGSTYQAPFDLCISRLEKRPFWHDPSKTWLCINVLHSVVYRPAVHSLFRQL